MFRFWTPVSLFSTVEQNSTRTELCSSHIAILTAIDTTPVRRMYHLQMLNLVQRSHRPHISPTTSEIMIKYLALIGRELYQRKIRQISLITLSSFANKNTLFTLHYMYQMSSHLVCVALALQHITMQTMTRRPQYDLIAEQSRNHSAVMFANLKSFFPNYISQEL